MTAKFADVAIVVLLTLAMVSILFTSCKYIKNIACRMCCMYPAPKQKKNGKVAHANDTFVGNAAVALALVAIPVALMVTSFKLDLGENMTSFILFSVGIVMMFVAELVFSVLKKAFGVANEDVRAVLMGCPTCEEADEEEAAEEAATEEVVIEEAPAEEAVVEEAVAEEAPAEEAPAEEAPAEEEAKANDAE